MSRPTPALLALNRGIVSRLALARTDLDRVRLSASQCSNWMPRTLGSMIFRPGLAYTGSTYNNNKSIHIPFIFAKNDTAIIEVSDENFRVKVDETVITRASVSSAITNGTFDSDLTGWTDSDEAGATSVWVTGGYMGLTGTDTNAAIRDQQVTVSGGDINTEHALRIIVTRGKVSIRVGSTSGDDDYISETQLGVGTHSLAFTPTGNFHIRFFNRSLRQALLDSVAVESSGDMVLPSPWDETELYLLRWDQSADVIFVACDGYQQRRIERRGTRSWSIVLYQPEDGPFRVENVSAITLAPSALSGNVTLTASKSFFRDGHEGALFNITSTGQRVESSFTAENQFGDSIRVTGITSSRIFTIILTGTWSATVTLQRSVGSEGNWEDVTTYTGNTTVTYDDDLDNQIIYYRLGVKTGDFTSGTVSATLVYSLGSKKGVARILTVSSPTSATAEVLEAFGGTTASDIWAEGIWSDYRGWPSAVALFEGRLWWAGKGRLIGSVSDAYESFDSDTEGDSGPISRTIGSGPVDDVFWLLPLQRLMFGTASAEYGVKTTALDEPITPTNFSLKAPSTQGSAAVNPVKIDTRGLFVQSSGTRMFELSYNINSVSEDYANLDITQLVPEIGEPSIIRVAVQRQPDTRIHCVRSDGTVAVFITEVAEDVKAWVEVETDGEVEDVFVLPGTIEDKVYYSVKRTVNGSTVRFLERWALESEAIGGDLTKLVDAHVVYDSTATTTLACAHLEGEEVSVWGDGVDLGLFTVASGVVTVPTAVSKAVIGLTYRARFKSTKLAYGSQRGTALNQNKQVQRIGFILANTHASGLKYGNTFDDLSDLPLVEEGAEIDADYVWEEYDFDMMEFDDTWSTDPRICLEANSPKPCTVLGITFTVDTNDGED